MRPPCLACLAFAAGLLAALSGCAPAPPPAPDALTVEGTVTARGAEPFSALVLTTPAQNHYVLTFEPDAEQPPNPARLRVTGRLYLDEWAGQPFAHLRVDTWEALER